MVHVGINSPQDLFKARGVLIGPGRSGSRAWRVCAIGAGTGMSMRVLEYGRNRGLIIIQMKIRKRDWSVMVAVATDTYQTVGWNTTVILQQQKVIDQGQTRQQYTVTDRNILYDLRTKAAEVDRLRVEKKVLKAKVAQSHEKKEAVKIFG
ncbi:hypothetical protein HD806DRAFT_276479 [Xylariaceae sp. AK1471]|nr:hypothetical protein HD806DRAFT_276479 [Xylariaceae sp. AK1471]